MSVTPLPAAASLKPTTPQAMKAWKTSQDFEAQFLKTMLEQAFAGLEGEGPMGGAGPGGEAWRSLLIDQHARAISAKGGVGIAAMVYRQTLAKLAGGLNGTR